MLNFLKQSRKLLNTKEAICLVIGNESCDLDSAVCALSLAYFYQQRQAQRQPLPSQAQHFLPVLNIPRRDYPTKTEVNYLFKQHAISEELLTFWDDLREDLLARSDCILVDHHVSPLATRCVEVYDHRPLDSAAQLPPHCQQHIELVGSCATLIADLILHNVACQQQCNLAFDCNLVLSLLRSTIILDTVNFAESAARATPKDHAICEAVEQQLCGKVEIQARTSVFDALLQARADTSCLTPLQLLRKDLKVIENTDGSLKVALAGFPVPVQQFIQQPEAANAVQEFAQEHDYNVVLLLSYYVSELDGSVQRELGVVDINQPELCAEILKRLLESTEPALQLEACQGSFAIPGHFFTQHNVKATRKHMLPIVKQTLEKWPSTERAGF